MGVVNLRSGQPTMALTGGAAAPGRDDAARACRPVIHLSLTDDHPYAQAFVIIEAAAGERARRHATSGGSTILATVAVA